MLPNITPNVVFDKNSPNIEALDNSNSDIGDDSKDNKPAEHNYPRDNDNNKHRIHKCESLDEGTFAFMHWMNSDDKKSLTSENPMVLVKFVNDKHTILYDTDLRTEVDVEIDKGVPYCKYCKEDDCSHVGFAICIEQFYGNRGGSGSDSEETMEDIITNSDLESSSNF
jgi:hypothetical protein